MQFTAVRFADLPGWHDNDHARSAGCVSPFVRALAKKSASDEMGGAGYAGTVGDWVEACNGLSDASGARDIFREKFHAIRDFRLPASAMALFTGYYEPELRASRTKHGAYQTPVYGLPPDLDQRRSRPVS